MIYPTSLAAVIGDPIAHSLSPVMHSFWLQSSGIQGEYQACHVLPETLKSFMKEALSSSLTGFNVTLPHKTAIVPLLDRLAPSAERLGAVNTVARSSQGGFVGYNTDGIGFLNHLNQQAPSWRKESPALVMGAGGAARAIIHTLLSTPVPVIMVSNRSRSKAEKLAHDLGRDRVVVIDWQDRQEGVKASGIIINTTCLGMNHMPALDLDLSKAAVDTTIYDIVYTPLITPLLKQATRRGLKTVDGLGMLIHQGAAASKIWFKDRISPNTGVEVRKCLLSAMELGETGSTPSKIIT